MDVMQRFLAYAGDFEKTLADDDWTRLRQYFADDAVYEVRGAEADCRIDGPDAIFRGMKKSLDGFDRKFERRDVEITSGPEIEGNQMRLGWTVTYHKQGLPPFPLRGTSTVRYAGDKIAHLIDTFDDRVGQEFADWQRRTGIVLDASYV